MTPHSAPAQSDVTARLRDLKKERDVLDALNTQLRANQADLKAALAAGEQREREQAAEVVDLQEQARAVGHPVQRAVLDRRATSCEHRDHRPPRPAAALPAVL